MSLATLYRKDEDMIKAKHFLGLASELTNDKQ